MGQAAADIQPENVLLTPDGDGPESARAKILDFGIAKFLTATTGKQTTVGLILGTPSYMAPEQCEGRDNLTDRVDVYALGIILYQMLAGRPPFVAQSGSALMRQHMVMEPPPLRKQLPTVPEALHELVHAMLAKTATDRPAMARVVERLQLLRTHHGTAAGPGVFTRRRVVSLGIVLLMVGFTGAALLASNRRHATPAQVAVPMPTPRAFAPPSIAVPPPAVPSHLDEEHRLAADKQHKHKPGKPLAKETHLATGPSAEVSTGSAGRRLKPASPAAAESPTPSSPKPKPGSRLTNGDIEPDR